MRATQKKRKASELGEEDHPQLMTLKLMQLSGKVIVEEVQVRAQDKVAVLVDVAKAAAAELCSSLARDAPCA